MLIKKSKKWLILPLAVLGTLFFVAFPSAQRVNAGEILAPFVDPLSGVIIADVFSCSINIIWGCDSSGNPIEPKPCQTSDAGNFMAMDLPATAKDVELEHGCGFTREEKVEGYDYLEKDTFTCSNGNWVNRTHVEDPDPSAGCFVSWHDSCGNTSARSYIGSCDGSVAGFSPECGSAAGVSSLNAPSENLCATGSASAVTLITTETTSSCTEANYYDLGYDSLSDCQAVRGVTVVNIDPFWKWACSSPNVSVASVSCIAPKTTSGGACVPSCQDPAMLCVGQGGLTDGCGGTCPTGTKTDGACCVSNGCEANTCTGSVCDNGCSTTAPGIKTCNGTGVGNVREVQP